MADSVVKIRIDSKEADANIKHTGQALADYFRKVREGDGTFAKLDEGVMEAIKAIREMGTKADSTRGALRELTQATTDLTAAYRSLDNEALQSDTGKELSKTIEILTQRAGEAKDAMGDVSAAITSSASDTRGFDRIAGGISLMTSGFQTAVGAANLFGLEIGNQEKVLTTLASAMSITNGLQTVQNLLQSQSALMMGVQAAQASLATAAQTALAAATGSATIAQKAFNVVANANPYVLLATAVTAVSAALYAFVSGADEAEKEAEELAKAQEEAKKKADDARNAFVNASAEAMNSASRLDSLQVAYMNANSEMEKTSILKQAQEQFKKLGIECNGLNDAQTLLIKNGSAVLEMIRLQGTIAALSAVRMEAFKNSFKMLMENGYSASAAAIMAGDNGDVMELDEQITQMQTRIQGLKDTLHINENKGGRTVTKNKVTPEEILPEGSMAALTKQMQELQKEQKLVTSYSGWQEYQQKIEAVSDRISLLKGELPKNKEAVFTVTAETQDAIDKLRDIDGVKIDPKGVTVTAETSEAIAALQCVDGLTIQPKTAEVTFTANDADVLAKVRDIEGVTIDPKTLTVTAETSEAIAALQRVDGLTIQPKTAEVTFTANDADVLAKVRDIEGVKIDPKGVTVTAQTQEAIAALQRVDGLTIPPKTAEVTFTANDADVLAKVRDIDGVTIDPKTLTVTAQTQEAIAALQRVDGLTIPPKTAEVTFTANDADVLAKVRDIDGVTIDPKTLTVTAETSEALRSVQELIGGLEGTTIQLKVKAEPQDTAIGTSIQNSAGLSEYISDLQKQLSTANFATPLYNNLQAQLADTTALQNLVGEALKVGLGTALFDVADETGADFWTRAMEGGVKNIDWQAIIDQINEARKAAGLDAISLDFASGSVSTKEKKDGMQDSKTVLNAVSQLTDGLQKVGIEIPSEIQSVISVMQGVIQVIEAVNAIIGVTQTTALTANTIAMTSLTAALWANTATSWIPGLAGGGIVPHFAGGGLIGKAALGMTIPGHSYSGDLLRLPVDGGRGMIGVNSGEVIMNQAQAGILESELSGGRMRDINVHGVLQGENIVLAVSNYFRRTGKGEAAMWGKN